MKVALIPNVNNPQAMDGAVTLFAWLERQGIETVLFDGSAKRPFALPFERSDDPQTGTNGFVSGCDLVISLGGDGTTLRAARMIAYAGIPLLSINYGTLGFLSGASSTAMIEAVTTVLSGEVEPIRRTTLHVAAQMADGTEESYFALNEAVVQRGNTGRIVSFSYRINGVLIVKTRGDGILVSTATGSTGYALSAGGPLIVPSFKGFMVLPIAAHSLANRAIVCSASDTVELDLSDKPNQEASLCIDGVIRENCPPLCVTVTRGKEDLLTYQLNKDGFLDTAAHVFFGRKS